jgi:hypothetical protein
VILLKKKNMSYGFKMKITKWKRNLQNIQLLYENFDEEQMQQII